MRILITGASSEIAKAIAARRQELGDEIFLTSSTVHKSPSFEGRSHYEKEIIPFDLRDPESSNDAFDLILDQGIDGLILNAWSRVDDPKPFLDWSPQASRSHIETNLYGNLWLIQKLLPRMIKNGFGRLVFLSSLSSVQGTAGYAPYSMAKAAMESLFYNLAVDYGDKGITANIVRPGLILTSRIADKVSRPARQTRVERIIPQGRLGTPQEVAVSLDSLLAKDCYINGAVLQVSGGLPMLRSGVIAQP